MEAEHPNRSCFRSILAFQRAPILYLHKNIQEISRHLHRVKNKNKNKKEGEY